MITWSLKTFQKNINDYDDFCTPEAKFSKFYKWYRSHLSRIKFGMNHVTKFCKEEFGWQWKKAMEKGQLQKVADARKKENQAIMKYLQRRLR